MTEPIPEWTPITAPVTQSGLDALGRFAFQVRRLLSGKLTQSQNMRAQWLDAVIQWPNAAVPAIATRPTLATRPRAVYLSELRIGTVDTVPATLAATLQWDFSAGSILLPQFANDTLTTRWHVRLLVVEE